MARKDKPESEEKTDIVDAYYKPKDQSPKLPRVYDYTKELPVEKTEGGDRAATIFALCLACVILGIGLGSIRSREVRVEEAAEPVDRIVSVMTAAAPSPVTVEAPAEETLSSGEIYNIARKQTVEIRVGSKEEEISCSGTILTPDGYILSGAHMLGSNPEEADITVVLCTGEQYAARLMGYERTESDLAILKINEDALPAPVTGDINEMDVGQRVYAVGNPRGENTYSMSEGMITDREQALTIQNGENGRKMVMNLFRISAPVNEGNVGGPVYNTMGEIIGIVITRSLQTEGVTYCIPINDAELVARKLTDNRYVGGKARLGIIAQTVSETVADYYNRYSADSMVPGVQIYAIDEAGCAFLAGLQRGDIIVRFGSFDITSEEDLASAEKEYRAGESIDVTVFRAGKYLQVTVRPEDVQSTATDDFFRQMEKETAY